MIEFVDVEEGFTLEDYASISHLTLAVQELCEEARVAREQLRDRTIWMVNSTAQGGGVAEMLPKMVSLLNELGIKTRWAVIGSEEPAFFSLTKQLHNLIHGEGSTELTEEQRVLYERENRANADSLQPHLGPDDLLVVHDPQPMAMGAMIKTRMGLRTVWRCHIGLDRHVPETRAAWNFLEPYAGGYDHAVFSAPEYIPDYLAGMTSIIHPALDPESHKNRGLSPHKLVGILCNSGLKRSQHPVLTPDFDHLAQRLTPDGNFVPAMEWDEVGVLFRPIVTQVSRWDRLKGFKSLMDGFVRLKQMLGTKLAGSDLRHHRRLQIVRLILAGPDPASIQDDPEGKEVLGELCDAYCRLPSEFQEDIALLALPMDSKKENALMVNALQRCSTVVVQNSLREGFGLTMTEAMWKGLPVLGSQACGLRQQVRNGIDGILIEDPLADRQIAHGLNLLLEHPARRDRMARTAQRRVYDEFLVFTQLRRWLRLLVDCANRPAS